jgi:hypothetical protein
MLKERTLSITVTVDMDKALQSGEIEASVWAGISETVARRLFATWGQGWERPWDAAGVSFAAPSWDGPGVEAEE